jgi:hypothetical protein
MATVGEHDCGWGVLRLRVNGLSVRTGPVSGGESGSRNRILMGRVLAPFHGSRPALGHRNRVALFPPSNPLVYLEAAGQGFAAAIVGCEQHTRD